MGEWIKCSERLPELNQPVLVNGPSCAGIGARCDLDDGTWSWGFACCGIYWDDAEGWVVDEYDADDFDVTEWMPLPEPPQ